MFKNISNLKKGIVGTFLLIILIPIVNFVIINFPIQNNFINAVAPLFFLIFLLSPYLYTHSNFIGGFFGFLIYSLVLIKLNFTLSFLFSISIAFILLFYSSLFKKEPEKKAHIVLNVFVCLISTALYAWLSSLVNSITFHTAFVIAFQAYFYFGLISTTIIIPLLTYLYGVKLNSNTTLLRK